MNKHNSNFNLKVVKYFLIDIDVKCNWILKFKLIWRLLVLGNKQPQVQNKAPLDLDESFESKYLYCSH